MAPIVSGELPPFSPSRPSPNSADEPTINLRGVRWLIAEIGELRHPRRSTLARFIAIGSVSTVAYVVFLLLLSQVLSEEVANVTASVLTTLFGTAANCVFTFPAVHAVDRLLAHAGGLLALAIGILISSVALWILADLDAQPSAMAFSATLVAATSIAGLVRFGLLRKAIRRAGVETAAPDARRLPTEGDRGRRTHRGSKGSAQWVLDRPVWTDNRESQQHCHPPMELCSVDDVAGHLDALIVGSHPKVGRCADDHTAHDPPRLAVQDWCEHR